MTSEDETEKWTEEANNGSVDHMMRLAKHFLDLAKNGTDAAQNNKMAVNWLIKASTETNDEATELLRKCLEEKIGIDSGNLEDVKWCLRSSDLDKAVRFAAKKLFHDLKSGKDANLSKKEFLEGLKKITNEDEGKKALEAMGQLAIPDEGVSEESFVSFLAERLALGGSVQDDVEMEAWAQANFSDKLTKHGDTTISVFVDGLLEFLSTDMVNIVMTIIPWDQFNVLVFFFIFSILSFAFLYKAIVMLTFYVSFLLLVTTTARMIKEKRNLQDVISLSRVLKRYSAKVSDEEAVAAHTMKSMAPYWTFFSALMVAVPAFAYTLKGWVPCAEFAVLSLVLSGVCLAMLCDLTDPLIQAGIAVELYAALPVLLADFPDIPLVSSLIWLVTDTLFSLELLDGIHFNFGVPALAYLALPFMFYYMACKNERSWHGVYTALIPFLVSFLWWNMGIMFFNHSTYMQMAQGSLGWVGFVLFFPFIAAWAIIKGTLGFIFAFTFGAFLKFVVALVLLIIPIAISLWKDEGFGIGDFSLRGKSIKAKMVAFTVPVFVAIILVFSPEPSTLPPEEKFVSWDLYKELCSKPAWEKGNMATIEMQCHHFRSMMVSWNGTVNNVVVSSVDNPAEKLLDTFPEGLAEWLKCMYGERYDDCDKDKMDAAHYEACQMRQRYSRDCHVDKHAELTFVLSVKLAVDEKTTQDITLSAGDEYRDILLRLKPGDQVNFQGSLNSGMGSGKLKIGLSQIECTSCEQVLKQEEKTESLMDKTVDALLHTFNFIFAPLVEYRKTLPVKQIGEQATPSEDAEVTATTETSVTTETPATAPQSESESEAPQPTPTQPTVEETEVAPPPAETNEAPPDETTAKPEAEEESWF